MLNKIEKVKVAEKIKDLFDLKGVFNTKDQIETITNYFADKKYYLSSILQGIQRLESEPLTVITNDRIEESIKAIIKPNSNNKFPNCILRRYGNCKHGR